MSTLEVIDLLDEINLDLSPDLHWPCCRRDDVFICGVARHPEADIVALGLEDEEDGCATCRAAHANMPCQGGSARISHFHCPLDGRICPFTADGRRVRE